MYASMLYSAQLHIFEEGTSTACMPTAASYPLKGRHANRLSDSSARLMTNKVLLPSVYQLVCMYMTSLFAPT